MVANLERIRTSLEKESGRVVTMSCWAEAAGIEVKLLQQHLHFGWYCRDELIRSTRSLVLYFARNYRGVGISLEDLLQVCLSYIPLSFTFTASDILGSGMSCFIKILFISVNIMNMISLAVTVNLSISCLFPSIF